MAQVRFDINKAFKEVFGVYGQVPLFPLAKSGQGGGESQGDFPQAEMLQEGNGLVLEQGMNGAVIIDRFAFGVQKLPSEGSGYYYFLSPYTLLEVSRSKNIVKTPMLGRNGTIKEFITLDDWQLSFKGFLINEQTDELPYEQTARLLEVFGVNEHLVFDSEIVRRWFQRQGKVSEGENMDFIVIEEVKLPPMDGFSNVQPFEITAVSDNPIEIQLLTNA